VLGHLVVVGHARGREHDDVVPFARHVVDLLDLRRGEQLVLERDEQTLGRTLHGDQAHGDDQIRAEPRVEHGRGPGDQSGVPVAPDPPLHRARRQPDELAQLTQRAAGVGLQFGEQVVVGVVQGELLGHATILRAPGNLFNRDHRHMP
jgi:hypothetical protein